MWIGYTHYKVSPGDRHVWTNAADAAPKATPDADPFFLPTFSRDGRKALAAVSGGVEIWSFDGAAPALSKTYTNAQLAVDGPLFEENVFGGTDSIWVPGNERIFYRALDAANGNEFRILDLTDDSVFTVAKTGAFVGRLYSSDAKWVAWNKTGTTVQIGRMNAPATVHQLGDALAFRWSPSGQRIGLRGGIDSNYEMRVYNVATGSPVLEWVQTGILSLSFEWASDADRLYVHERPNGSQDRGTIFLADFEMTPRQVVEIVAQTDDPPLWAPSGKYVLTSNLGAASGGTLWDAATATDVTPSAIAAEQGEPLAVSPDDRWLVWKSVASGHQLTDLKSSGYPSVQIAGLGHFTHDSTAFIARTSNTSAITYNVYDLTGATPSLAGSFNTTENYQFLGQSADTQYVFWLDEVAVGDRRLMLEPIRNGTLLPTRQISDVGHNVRGFACASCVRIE